MIYSVFITFIFSILNWFVSFFPLSTGLPSEAHSAFISLGGYLSLLDPLVPISTLLSCVTLVFSVEIAIFGFHTFRWIISHLPFIGGNA